MSTSKLFGCCSLRTGAITWGTITLIIDTVILSGIVAVLAKWDGYHDYWGFCCIPFIVDQLAAIGLVFGAVKERCGWVLFWLVVHGVLIVGFVVVLVVLAIFVGYTCVLLMCLGVLAYMWTCNFAYYRSLCEEEPFGDPSVVYTSVLFDKV